MDATTPTAPPIDCACGKQHAPWWRTVQAPSCTLPRYIEHNGLIYTPQQWATYQQLLAAATDAP